MTFIEAAALVDNLALTPYVLVDLGAREGPEHDFIGFKVRIERDSLMQALCEAYTQGVNDFTDRIIHNDTEVILIS